MSGRIYEAIAAFVQRRPRCELYHSALEIRIDAQRIIVEQTPVTRGDPAARGVVASGAVGLAWLGRWRMFRYEIHRWPGGAIPDVGEAVGGARRISDDPAVAQRILDVLPRVPTPTWGRDELHLGEMWNSNSVIAWTLAQAGLDPHDIALPDNGRAPGWHAGIEAARRQPTAP